MDVAGRTIIVTGGSSGIGRSIAITLADHDAAVVIADTEREPRGDDKPTDIVIQENGGEARFIQTDVTDEDSVQHMVYTAAKTYDGVSGLVNNAGVHHSSTIHEEDSDAWQRLFAVNVDGYYLCMKYVLDHFVREDVAGDIVNIGSIAGLVGFGESAAYCASKGAVVELTREAAVDYGSDGINVNAVDPGVIKTEMTAAMRDDEEQRRFLANNTVAPRLGEPDDVADAALFLLSSRSDFVMGENLVVDGGWTAR
jgi:3-oxoacyl-[acyl-carrier protein] reductase/meso-butanediol dehydrogenase/(S,S)-butanediol dehydrogenase/diacetyl reductase